METDGLLDSGSSHFPTDLYGMMRCKYMCGFQLKEIPWKVCGFNGNCGVVTSYTETPVEQLKQNLLTTSMYEVFHTCSLKCS